ncbi:MAG: glycosyltransferase, partial [Pseudolabrys sp.]|nr:glycosyltransferase [Pseudolabrys sp.]
MTKLLRVGYTTLAQSIAKGNLRLDDIETVNLHFNYGQFFDSVLYFVPFGKETLHYQLTPKISYEEIAFSAKRSFWLSALSHLMAVRRRLKSMIDEFRPDVVEICGPHIPAWVFLSVPSVWRCGTVCRIEAYWEDIIDHQTYFPVVIRRLLPLWYRIVYRIFDVYTGTPSLAPEFYVTKGMRRDRIAQWVQDIDLRIIDNSPRVEDSRLAALQPPRIVVVGRLHTEKLPGDALAIFRECVTRGQPGSLIFVGDGPERSALEQDVARYGLSDRAIFLGQQPLHSVIGVMKACDLMIAPMQGTALLEAMATGLAIVAYDHETHRAHIRDGINGRLVPHRDIAAAAAALGELLADPAERRRLA